MRTFPCRDEKFCVFTYNRGAKFCVSTNQK